MLHSGKLLHPILNSLDVKVEVSVCVAKEGHFTQHKKQVNVELGIWRKIKTANDVLPR